MEANHERVGSSESVRQADRHTDIQTDRQTIRNGNIPLCMTYKSIVNYAEQKYGNK